MYQNRRNRKRNPRRRKKHGESLSEKKKKVVEIFELDPRGGDSKLPDVFADNLNPAMVERERTSVQPFYAPGLAIISWALQRNWQTVTTSDDYPYFAYVFMGRALARFALSGTPLTAKVPKWFALIIQAVIFKTVPFQGGRVNYNFDFNDSPDENDVQPMGPGSPKHYLLWKKKVPAEFVNGNVPVLVPPSTYTEEGGQLAIQSLYTFLAGLYPNHPMHQMVATNEKNVMTNDASAYAVNQLLAGGGYAEAASFARLARLEVPIRTPLFSVFVGGSPAGTGQAYRYPNFVRNFGGDGVYLGGYLVEGEEKNMHFKSPPAFKFIDFNEFGNVLLLTITKAVQIYVESQFFLEAQTADPNHINTVLCELTVQQVLTLLRAQLLIAFGGSQIRGQALYPRIQVKNESEFVSFVCGTGQVAVPMDAMMLLPFLLKENINALRERSVPSKRGGHKNEHHIAPVLGLFEGDSLNREDYVVTYTIGEEKVTVPVFADDTGETPIDLIDGSYGSGQYAALSDPAYLMPLTSVWNQFIQKRSDNLRHLATLGADPGVNSLYSGFMTRYFVPQTAGDVELGHYYEKCSKVFPWDEKKSGDKEKVSKKKEDIERVAFESRVQKMVKKDVGTSLYDRRAIIAYSAGGMLFKAAWTALQQYWIVPVMKVQPAIAGNASTDVYSMGALYREPMNMIPAVGSVTFPTLQESHSNFADIMIKNAFSATTDIEDQLLAMAEKGEAGIIGTLAQAILPMAGNVAGQVVGSIANAYGV